MRFLCPACDHEDVSTIITAGEYRYAHCASCGSFYLSPMPGADEPARELHEFAAGLRTRRPATTAAQRRVVKLLAGAGVQRGSTVATDMAGPLVDGFWDCRSLDDVNLSPTAPPSEERFDAIVLAAHGIGRAAQPDKVLEGVLEALAPGGSVALYAANSLFARLVMAMRRKAAARTGISPAQLLGPPRRKVVYSARGLRSLVERCGFEGVRVRSGPAVSQDEADTVERIIYGVSCCVQAVLSGVVLNHSLICVGTRKD